MKRLENGLVEGINYIRDEKTGKIDWLKMIPPEYLYINQDKKNELEKRLGKSFDQIKIEDVKDTDLVITLQGIRFLLDLRGYKYARTKIDVANQDYAAATCEICFLPNEEENFEQIFTACASAHSGNTKSWYANYLVEASSNRALCRATRNYLKINIVSREELSDNNETQQSDVPAKATATQIKLLTNLMEKKHVLWVHIREKLEKAEKWKDEYKSVADLPKSEIFDLIERLKKYNPTP